MLKSGSRLERAPGSRKLPGAGASVVQRDGMYPMRRHAKSNSDPYSIRKILSPRNRADPYEYLTKTIADVEERPPTEHDERIRAIGKRACRLGGITLMREVFWRLDRQGIKVGYRWDGIGGWYK